MLSAFLNLFRPNKRKSSPLDEAALDAFKAAYSTETLNRLLGPLSSPKRVGEECYLPDDVIGDFLIIESAELDNTVVIPSGYAQFTDALGQINIASKLSTGRRLLVKKCQSAELMLWPMCFAPHQQSRDADKPIPSEGHWLLMVIHKDSTSALPHFQCDIMDGLNCYTDSIPPFLTEIARQFISVVADECSISFSSPSLPEQRNGYDCGPAICYAGRQIMNKKGRESDVDYTDFRKEILRTLAQETDKTPAKKKRRKNSRHI